MSSAYDCVFSPSSPHLLPKEHFSPQNRISFELLALSGFSGFSVSKRGKVLIFQGFASSHIVREFPAFSANVGIATMTRNDGAYSTPQVRIGAAESAYKFSPSNTGKVFYRIFQKGVKYGKQAIL